MAVLDDVSDLIRRYSPQPLCDDCIAEELRLSVRQHANHKTRELANKPGFHRTEGSCSRCKADKKVIWYA